MVWGAGGHAAAVSDVVRRVGGFDVVAYVDDVSEISPATTFGGKPVRRSADVLKNWAARALGFVAIGDPRARRRATASLIESGCSLATLIDPSAVVSATADIGEGVLVMPRCVVNANALVETGAILNTGSVIEHHCQIGSFAHIAPGATLGGGVTVGADTLVGIGSSVRNRIRIGMGCTVGVGAAVVADVGDGLVVTGVPARPRKGLNS